MTNLTYPKVILLTFVIFLLAACTQDVTPRVIRVTPTAAPTSQPTKTPRPKPTSTSAPLFTCYDLYPSFVEAVEYANEDWDDALDIVVSTSRMNLAEPIAELQRIKRDFSRLDAPGCGELVQIRGVLYYESLIDMMIAFMSEGDEGISDLDVEKSSNYQDNYIDAIIEMRTKNAWEKPTGGK